MTNRTIVQRFASIVGIEHVSSKDNNCITVYPSSTSQVSSVLQAAQQLKMKVLPVGKERYQPDFSMDSIVFVSIVRMNEVTRLDEESMVVTAQAGITGQELKKVLKNRNLTIGNFPEAMLESTIGGMLAVRTSGKANPRLGFFENSILALTSVLPSSHVIRTKVMPPHSSGPDPRAIFSGSMGRFGIVTSLSLRMRRIGETELKVGFKFKRLQDAVHAAYLALHEESTPDLVEIWSIKRDESIEHVLIVESDHLTDIASCDRDLFVSASQASDGMLLTDHELQEFKARPKEVMEPSLYTRPHKLSELCDVLQRLLESSDNDCNIRLGRIDEEGASISLSANLDIDSSPLDEVSFPAMSDDPMDEYTKLLRKELDPSEIIIHL